MRVTQRTMYDTMLGNMQSTLGAYMESNIQGGSQKKINRPSDDPAGMALVLNTRRNIDSTTQYQRNADTAKGWLSLADSTLMQVSSTLSSIKQLAEQASTDTMTDENRDQVASQLRQLFGQLLNLSNTKFENKSIFSGHKYDQSAFEQVLGVTTKDPNLKDANITVTGKSESSLMVQFKEGGTVGGADDLDYRWTKDGGKTWTEGTLPAGTNHLDLGGVGVTIPNGSTITAADPDKDVSTESNGTTLLVRPTAQYMGDENGPSTYGALKGGPVGLQVGVTGELKDNVQFRITNNPDLRNAGDPINYEIGVYDAATGTMNWTGQPPVNVPSPATGKVSLPFTSTAGNGSIELDASTAVTSTIGGATVDMQPRRTDVMGGPADLMVNAQGTFKSNTLVRMDNDVNLRNPNTVVNYSYSNDGGQTWIKANAQTPNPATGSVRLPLPGGYAELTGNTTVTAGTQMIIHPDRADLNFEIMQDTYLSVNQVGKDIFGGVYNGQVVGDAESNMFEVVGNLIAYAENNDSKGVAECLAQLTKVMGKIETANAKVGGMENRVTMATEVLTFEKLDQQERLSYTEDIDLTTLLTNLAKQELAYNTVLKSSSMIMQLNLTKFV